MFPECGVGLAQGSMRTHLLAQHGWLKRLGREAEAATERGCTEDDVGAGDGEDAPQEYRVPFPQ